MCPVLGGLKIAMLLKRRIHAANRTLPSGLSSCGLGRMLINGIPTQTSLHSTVRTIIAQRKDAVAFLADVKLVPNADDTGLDFLMLKENFLAVTGYLDRHI